MPVTPGARLGAYEMLALIGAGGMGEVYRARDTKLGRPVAIKVLLAAVALDADRIARFEREAKLLAALNHPHIAALYGMEEAEGQQFLVMELVEGETLAERLTRGALPVDAALRIAMQIADALEAAHEKSIIHRDLKPANIKITPDDRVKVLDFGLARTADVVEADGAIGRTHSPTLSLMATQAGLILGTAAYMSPEQAKGLQADHRSDVFSFGCVLYEMITGAQAFQGDSVPDILASVLAREPDLRALPTSLNPRLTELLRRCLDKNPKRRYQAAGDLRVELEVIAKSPHAEPTAQERARAHSVWRIVAFYALPGVIVGAIVGAFLSRLTAHTSPPRVVRTMIATSGNAAIFTGDDRNVAITPDGTRVVYVGGGGNRLYVRALDALEPTVIASGTGLRGPFISPDGEWVGYFDGDQQLMKVAITGGPPVRIIGRIDGSNSRGATWGRDGNILFATSLSATGLQRVSAAGGPVTVVTRPDRARGEGDHLSPHLLPDGRAVLFTITFQTSPESPTIAVLDLDTGAIKELVRGGADAWYVATGHLVYTASATLRAVPFDRRTMTVSGAPVPVLDRIATAGTVNAGSFAVSDEGTLIYVHEPNGASGPSLRTLVWLDRTGKVQVIPAPPHLYRNPRISPDGTRIAVGAEDQQRDIWIWDVRRAVLTPLTSDPNVDTFPVWTPDGSRIVFASGRDTNINLWWQPANGLGSAERLLKSANIQIPTAVTHDGRDVVFHEVTAERSADILKVPLVGPRKPEPLVATKALERDAVVSPDGRWLAFESNTSGNLEVVVRTLVAGAEGQWQVSTNGGMRPAWSRNELFYVGPDGSLMGIAVPPGSAAWAGSTPTKITRLPDVSASVDFNRDYDVSLDGQRIVAIRSADDLQKAVQASLVLVQHWDQDVASRVKAK